MPTIFHQNSNLTNVLDASWSPTHRPSTLEKNGLHLENDWEKINLKIFSEMLGKRYSIQE